MRNQIDFLKVLEEYRIEHQLGSSGEWVNMPCPNCYQGDKKYGLGINLSSGAGYCWRCGGMDPKKAILKTIGKCRLEWPTTGDRGLGAETTRSKQKNSLRGPSSSLLRVSMPYGARRIAEKHKSYLKSRGFDPRKLESTWSLFGTENLGPYKHRIIAPITRAGKMVCYQGRDITGKAKERYKSCPDQEATVPIKNCLYGIDFVQNDRIVITEGITKVWRLGSGAVGTFGVNVTEHQLLLLSKFRERFILFDSDQAGIEKAESVAKRISVLGGLTEIISPCFENGVTDVADISDWEAEKLMKKLGFNF